MPTERTGPRAKAFTLIELLTVVAIISLLISILLPSLGRAREQAKAVHCAARLKDFANGAAAYENVNGDVLPPCAWNPDPDRPELVYGWMEPLFSYIWHERVYDPNQPNPASFPVQRNVDSNRFQEYFLCKSSRFRGTHSGHYRAYLPSWAAGTYSLLPNERFDLQNTVLEPRHSASRSAIPPRMPLLGDANEQSERIDASFIDAGEADTAGTAGFNGNRFSDRHYGGSNFLFQDLHAEWQSRHFIQRLSVDVDLNGVNDVDVVP